MANKQNAEAGFAAAHGSAAVVRARLECRCRKYGEVHFRNGYRRDAPFMRVKCLGISTGENDGKPCYVIRLGALLELRR
jgi:hypothetical protein